MMGRAIARVSHVGSCACCRPRCPGYLRGVEPSVDKREEPRSRPPSGSGPGETWLDDRPPITRPRDSAVFDVAPSASRPGGSRTRPSSSSSGSATIHQSWNQDPADSGKGASVSQVMERPAWVREQIKHEDAAPLILRPGAMIPGTRYRVENWLGDGSMGVVYAARHVDIDRLVAVKILRLHGGPHDPIASFRQEARVASKVGSEYIAQVHDFAELPGGRLMYAMEFVDGHALSRSLRKEGPMKAERAIPILRQVAKALHAAHAEGVIHRDIKPDNIMLESKPRADRVRVVDFGVATIADKVKRTMQDLVGTPFYVAPEVVEGTSYDARVDMYSLGCTAYEMLCGQPPFIGEEVPKVLEAQALELPKPITERVPSVPKPLAAVIMRCLEKTPEARYANAAELEAALIEAQIESGIVTAWDELPLPDVDPEWRARLLAGLRDDRRRASRLKVLVAAIALVAGTAVAVKMLGSEEPVAAAAAQVDEQVVVDRLAAQARGAAKRRNFVYPDSSSPELPTAYTTLLELESLGYETANTAAATLRKEFATELRSLADGFYADDEQSAIAADFYAQALLFDPSDEVALARAFDDRAQLDALAARAAKAEFDQAELIALDAMGVAAETDAIRRRARMARLSRRNRAETNDPRVQALEEMQARPHPLDETHTMGGLNAPEQGAEAGDDSAAEAEAEEDDDRSDIKRAKAKAAKSIKAGQAALRRGDTRGAKSEFERALSYVPRSARAQHGLARAYFNESNFDRAIKHGRRAVSISPGNADYRIALGDAYFRSGQKREALEHYEAAAKKGRSDAQRRVEKVQRQL